MYINKYFKEFNIEPLYEVDVREKCTFANKAAILLVDAFPECELDYLKIVDLLQHTEMFISKVPKNISPVNYSYIDKKMYISDDIEFNVRNEFLLHEVIHRIQESRTKKEKLFQLGLCNILETKVKGLAINEAAVQYTVSKMLDKKKELIDIYGIKIQTQSKKYYPIITNLIEQLSFLLGENLLIDSTLNSNQEFKYNAIDILGENNYFTIQDNFDKILEAKNRILKSQDVYECNQNINIIQEVYKQTQDIIFSAYFNNEFKNIATLEELANFNRKLVKFKDYIGTNDGQYLYIKYYKNIQPQIKALSQSLQKKSLMVIKENKVMKIFKKIKKYIEKLVYQN